MTEDLERRKDQHLDLCLREAVEAPGTGTLLDCVHLVHDALPELSMDGLDLSTRVLGRTLRAPLLVVGMTGGTERAGIVNRDLARAAQKAGVAFGVGSQRPMARRAEAAATYRVRDVAPDVVLFGNIGAQQILELGVDKVRSLMEGIEADGLFVHLNPAQELVQPGGDRSFTGCLDAIARLAGVLGPKVWVKETGCGLSARVAKRLISAGVGGLDVSGAGGTSWTKVESLRAQGVQQALGLELAGWGVPTAAAVASCAGLGVPVVASGGVRSGTEVAKAIALGATLGGMALPCLKAQAAAGQEGVERMLELVERGLRASLLLTGSADLSALSKAPRMLSGELPGWIRTLAESA